MYVLTQISQFKFWKFSYTEKNGKKNLKHFFLKLVCKSRARIVYLQRADFAPCMKLDFWVSELKTPNYFKTNIIELKQKNGMNYIKLLLINVLNPENMPPKYRKLNVPHVSKVIFYPLHSYGS